VKVKQRPRSSVVLAAAAVLTAAGAVTLQPWADLGTGDRPSVLTVAPDGVSPAERVTIPESLRSPLLGLAEGDALAVQDWPVAPGVVRSLTFRRASVYAPDAEIFVVEAGQTRTVPRSSLAFLRGESSDGGTLALLALDPGTGAFTGMTLVDGEAFELLAPPAARPGEFLLAPRDGLLPAGSEPLQSLCSQDQVPRIASGLGAGLGPAGSLSLASRHYVVVAVDTDSELLALKFANNTTSAVNYLADIFARMNVFYERDLNVHLSQGTTFLRIGEPDPYSQGSSGVATFQQLDEFGDYWAANYGSVSRGLAAMFSGKSPANNSAAGIAWIGGTCSSSYGYSFSMVFKVSYNAGDASLVGHELGHNVGANHTHCLNPPVDICYNQEAGCYSGATTACPTPGTINGQPNIRGTLMSYCHMLAGCSKSDVFHEGSEAETDAHLGARIGVCVIPGATPPVPTPIVVVAGTPTPTPTRTSTPTPTPIASPTPTPVPAATSFFALTPCRVLDTRNANGPLGGPALAAGATRVFTVTGVCGIPSDATSISVNATITSPTAAGFLALYAGNGTWSGASTISFSVGQTRANNAVAMLATDGSGGFAVLNSSSGTVHFIVDVNGYFR
jgi:hypothetical protein